MFSLYHRLVFFVLDEILRSLKYVALTSRMIFREPQVIVLENEDQSEFSRILQMPMSRLFSRQEQRWTMGDKPGSNYGTTS
jgi:hypothetical protein